MPVTLSRALLGYDTHASQLLDIKMVYVREQQEINIEAAVLAIEIYEI